MEGFDSLLAHMTFQMDSSPCQAGRKMVHPSWPGWQKSCKAVGVQVLVIEEDDGSRMTVVLCALHMLDLERNGLVRLRGDD